MEGQQQQTGQRGRRFPWIRALVALLISLLIAIATLLTIFSTGHIISGYWLAIIPIVFSAAGLLIPLCQWLFPISTESKGSLLFLPTTTEPVTSTEQTKSPKTIWNIPYPRNLYFTGREDILAHLHETLIAKKATALTQRQAISGLGGIGKTQIALEYAYRHRQDYHAVLWINATTRDTIIASFLELATVLELPQQQEADQRIVITAVNQWFTRHNRWLLIFDNADDLNLARAFLPTSETGHILFTTRDQTLGTLAHSIDVATMDKHNGTLLVLRRAKLVPRDAPLEQANTDDRTQAEHIVEEMGGLPIALDQAAAYIEETQCRLANYLTQYQRQRDDLLQRRSDRYMDQTLPVATIWSLSFTQVQHDSPLAADLLRVCAFLAPDEIAEAMLLEGASQLGPLVATLSDHQTNLDKAIGVLRRYSLVQRNRETHTLSIHRLVQAALKRDMDEPTRKWWAERIIRAVCQVFPNADYHNWPQCEQTLAHALVCAGLIATYTFAFAEASLLIDRAGDYLVQRGQYAEAEPLLQRALDIREKVLGLHHPDTALSLNDLGRLYYHQGKYSQAEPLLQSALAIREKVLGPDHPDTALSLNDLGRLYRNQGKYSQAEPLLQSALAIRKKVLGPDHPDTALSLNNLGRLYYHEGKYAQAEPLLQSALAIRKKVLGPDHPDTARSLNNLARLYYRYGKYDEAEPLLQNALAIREKVLGPDHPATATSLNNLGALYHRQGKYAEAGPLLQRAFAIREKALGPLHAYTANSLNDLGALYHSQRKYTEAEPLLQRAFAIRENVYGPDHPDTARSLNYLAYLYHSQGKYAEAEPLLQRALDTKELVLGLHHPSTASSLNNLAVLYRSQRKYAEAEPLLQRAFAIRELVLGPNHPDTANSLNDLAILYYSQGKTAEAEPLLRRAFAIREKVLGLHHPDTAANLSDLAVLYRNQRKYAEAEPLLQRALDTKELVLGPDHSDTASSLSDLAVLYRNQRKYAEAEPLLQRAFAIRELVLGPNHPDTANSLNDLAILYYSQGNTAEAEPLLRRAFAIREKVLGPDHPDTQTVRANYVSLQQKIQ